MLTFVTFQQVGNGIVVLFFPCINSTPAGSVNNYVAAGYFTNHFVVLAMALQRFFQRGVGSQAGRFRVKAELRNRMNWHLMNLFQNVYPFDQKFHVIFCRNVMIYFDKASQEHLVQRMSRMLLPGGYLKVGHSESLSGIRHNLQTVRPAVYRKPI